MVVASPVEGDIVRIEYGGGKSHGSLAVVGGSVSEGRLRQEILACGSGVVAGNHGVAVTLHATVRGVDAEERACGIVLARVHGYEFHQQVAAEIVEGQVEIDAHHSSDIVQQTCVNGHCVGGGYISRRVKCGSAYFLHSYGIYAVPIVFRNGIEVK